MKYLIHQLKFDNQDLLGIIFVHLFVIWILPHLTYLTRHLLCQSTGPVWYSRQVERFVLTLDCLDIPPTVKLTDLTVFLTSLGAKGSPNPDFKESARGLLSIKCSADALTITPS